MIFEIKQGNCLQELKQFADSSIDSIVTDPPYGLSFMGKAWDYDVPEVEVWRECLRVLKPGGYLLAFAGTRTQHRMCVNIEDAGFEIRDMIAWVYGSGFPKSLDISKAIDKAAGAEREVVGNTGRNPMRMIKFKEQDGCERSPTNEDITIPATADAAKWQGWGTALKPALEPITVARKPFNSTVADNVLKHGTGGINIDGCRVGLEGEQPPTGSAKRVFKNNGFTEDKVYGDNKESPESGRFPANFIHDGSEDVIELFPQGGARAAVTGEEESLASVGTVTGKRDRVKGVFHNDKGSAARFFYCAKASKSERDAGLEAFDLKPAGINGCDGKRITRKEEDFEVQPRANNHPTVKPLALMRYLCRLVTPPGGVVLDPFCGSGTTGCAAVLEDFRFIGIEREADYVKIGNARILHHLCGEIL